MMFSASPFRLAQPTKGGFDVDRDRDEIGARVYPKGTSKVAQ